MLRLSLYINSLNSFLLFQDSLQGYKSQNKFLNKEILELAVLRRNAESREKALEAKVLCLQMVHCPFHKNRKSAVHMWKSSIVPRNAVTKRTTFLLFFFVLLQYSALEAKLCQVECKYLVLLQEVKTPVCSSSEYNAGGEVISRLLEDALQAETSDQQEHPIFKPNTVRWGTGSSPGGLLLL